MRPSGKKGTERFRKSVPIWNLTTGDIMIKREREDM